MHLLACLFIQPVQVWFVSTWNREEQRFLKKERQARKKVFAVELILLSSRPERHSATSQEATTPRGPIKTKSKTTSRVNCAVMQKDNSSASVNEPITENTCSSCEDLCHNKGHLLVHSQLINQLINAVWDIQRLLSWGHSQKAYKCVADQKFPLSPSCVLVHARCYTNNMLRCLWAVVFLAEHIYFNRKWN